MVFSVPDFHGAIGRARGDHITRVIKLDAVGGTLMFQKVIAPDCGELDQLHSAIFETDAYDFPSWIETYRMSATIKVHLS